MTGNSVSAIVVSFHTGPFLTRCLDGLLAQPEISQVILVDNGNPPEVLSDLQERAAAQPKLRLLTGHGNVGFAAGCNRGVEAATATHLLLFNPDAVMPEGGVATLLDEMTRVSGDRVALIGGRLIGPDGGEQAGSRRDDLSPATAISEMLRLHKLPRGPKRFNWHEETRPAETIRVPTISGACMLLRRADYARIGGMDEGYFLHVEDVDFCRRFRAAGGEILFCPDVEIIHEGGSSRSSLATVERLKAQSMTRYFRQHYSSDQPGLSTLASAMVWAGTGARLAKAKLDKQRARKK